MRFRFALIFFAFAACISFLPAQTNLPSTVTIAQFFEKDQSSKPVTFDATSGTFATPASVDVVFSYSNAINFTGALSALQGIQDATMTLQAFSPASPNVFGPYFFDEAMTGEITFLRKTPIDGKNTLLKIDFSTSQLLSCYNAGSLASASTAGPLTCSSDFLNLTATPIDNWALALSGLNYFGSVYPNSPFGTSFVASTTGTFDATAVPMAMIPEPATTAAIVGSAALVLVAAGRTLRSRRSRAVTTA